MSLKRNYVIKTETSAVVSGEMQALNLIDEVKYDIDFDPASGTDDYRKIKSMKLWMIDTDNGDLFAVPAGDTNIFNGTELIPGSWAGSQNGFYEVANVQALARVFLSDSDGKYRIIIPPLDLPAAQYVSRQGVKNLVLHVEWTTSDDTKGTFQIPLTLQNIGRTAYSGTI